MVSNLGRVLHEFGGGGGGGGGGAMAMRFKLGGIRV